MKAHIVAAFLAVTVAGAAVDGATSQAYGGELFPSLATVPAGWTVDRYDPAGFANVGPFASRVDVLGITTTVAQSLANRTGGQQTAFYNTQGRGYNLDGGAGSTLTADLFVPTDWGNALNGARRSDMWGVMKNGASVSDYPIIGFTNYGGAPRFRVWDNTVWVDLSNTIHYDEWNTLQIEFTGTSYVYSINGVVALTDSTVNGSTTVSRVLMQVYNFGDPASAPGAIVNDYTAYWSVPEPTTLLLLTAGLFGLGAARRRAARTPQD